MNPEEKTENDIAKEADPREEPRDESMPALEHAEEGQPRAAPDAEEREGSDEESVPEPEREKRTGRPRAEGSKLKSILEALIFVSEQPISLDRMGAVLTDCSRTQLKEVLNELEQEYDQRGGALEIVEVANGYQFRTRAEFAPWLGKLRQQKFARLSRAALETLAIVAYRQPVTRAEAEAIRGVDSGAVLGTLLERRLLRILGRKEVPGRPILYGTTQDFLELFGLKNLKDLPTLREIKDMVEATQEDSEPPEGETTEEGGGLGEEQEEQAVDADEEGAVLSGDADSPESEEWEDESEIEFESNLEGEEEEEGEPAAGDEISHEELDAILKSTKTRLELYEADLQAEEEAGRADSAEEGAEEGKKPGEGDNPDEG